MHSYHIFLYLHTTFINFKTMNKIISIKKSTITNIDLRRSFSSIICLHVSVLNVSNPTGTTVHTVLHQMRVFTIIMSLSMLVAALLENPKHKSNFDELIKKTQKAPKVN